MKILHVVPSYYPAIQYGGPIESVHNLNKWLVAQGAEVTVYTTDADGPSRLLVPKGEAVDVDGVKVFYFPLSFPKRWFYSWALHRALRKNINHFDCIHETSVFLSTSWLVAKIARRNRVPYIISPRGSFMKEPLKKGGFKKKIYIKIFEKKNLQEAAAIHFTIPLEEREFHLQKIQAKKIIIIPNSFDPQKFSKDIPQNTFRERYGIPKGDFVVLFLSRISWKKGFDTLIPAFAKIEKEASDAWLVIVGGDGEGYQEKVYEFIDREKNMKNKVIFTGMLVGDERIAAYQDADVFVLPSYAENFGNVILEAAYFGVPVVTTPTVGLADAIQKNNAGLVVEKDVEKFAAAIISLLRDDAKRDVMGKNGWRMALHDFSPKEVAEKWMKAYAEIIKENHG